MPLPLIFLILAPLAIVVIAGIVAGIAVSEMNHEGKSRGKCLYFKNVFPNETFAWTFIWKLKSLDVKVIHDLLDHLHQRHEEFMRHNNCHERDTYWNDGPEDIMEPKLYKVRQAMYRELEKRKVQKIYDKWKVEDDKVADREAVREKEETVSDLKDRMNQE